MALRVFEGWDVTTLSQIVGKIISQTGISGTNGNYGGNGSNTTGAGVYGLGKSWYIQAYAYGGGQQILTIQLDNQVTWIVQLHYNSSTTSQGFLLFNDTGTTQCYLGQNSSGFLQLVNGAGTVLATGTRLVSDSTWHYIQLSVTFGTTGSSKCYVDNLLQWNLTSTINTHGGGTSNNYANQVILQTASGNNWYYFDNLVIMDATGSAMNAIQTEMRVTSMVPNANGTVQFTASTGSNFSCVNQYPDDGDTTYVYSATVGNTDFYTVPTIPSGTILAVLSTAIARKDDVAVRTMAIVAKEGGTTYTGTTNTLTSSYLPFTQRWDVNDPAGNPWTFSNFNAMQFGVTVIS